ncbi:MAG: GIY-YIG nuclease family protein [bacterium]
MHYVYVLQSESDAKLYIGYTNDLKKRLRIHQEGKVQSTKRRLPLMLVYYEACLSKTNARDRERFLKTGWGRNYLKKRLAQ